MKAMGMAMLCLVLAPAAHEEGPGEEAGFPQFAAGEKRREILSRIRNDLVTAVKEGRPDRMDSLLREGDREFGRRIWMSRTERLYLYLLLGHGKKIVQDEGMRGVFWGESEVYSYGRHAFPRLCPGEGESEYIGSTQLGYAPDLIDHLKDRFVQDREAILERLKSQPDLRDLAVLARCPDPLRRGGGDLTRTDVRALEDFVRKHPDSRLAAEILQRSPINKAWTGNGWLIGGGAAFSWYDGKTRSLLDDGFQGSLFSDGNFPLLKTGIDFQIRPFTPRRPFAFDDTVVSDVDPSFLRIVLHAGHAFRLARNAYLTPFTGIIFSDLSLGQADEERLRKKDKSESSVGFPLGANLDCLYILPGQDNGEVLAAFGLRLSFAWHYGNWADMESGLGNQGAVLGLKLFYAMVGMRREG